MNYELHTLPEILAAAACFAIFAAFAWYFANQKDISDDSRTFR